MENTRAKRRERTHELQRQQLRKVYLACDADPRLTEPVEALCQAAGITVVTDYTMAQLGRACSIAVGTAAAAALEE